MKKFLASLLLLTLSSQVFARDIRPTNPNDSHFVKVTRSVRNGQELFLFQRCLVEMESRCSNINNNLFSKAELERKAKSERFWMYADGAMVGVGAVAGAAVGVLLLTAAPMEVLGAWAATKMIGGTALTGAVIVGGITYVVTDFFNSPLEHRDNARSLSERALYGKGENALFVKDMRDFITNLADLLKDIEKDRR
jgi:hypothetical protein